MLNREYIHGDCMEYLVKYPDNYFDVGIIDPPYGIKEDGRKAESRAGKVKQKNGTYLQIDVPGYQKDVGYDERQPDQSYFDELFRVSRHQIIWGCNYLQFDQKDSSSGRVIWDKVNSDSDQSDCEIAWTSLFSSVRQVELMWNGFNQAQSLKQPRRSQGNKKLQEKRIHPNQKPVMLYQWLLRNNRIGIQPGWHILDTHVGSASSLIAYELEGFRYTGFEIEESFYRQSRNRIISKLSTPMFGVL